MADAKQVLQDLIDETDRGIQETEGVIQAQQGCLVTLRKVREQLVAKKRGVEEDEKREAEIAAAANKPVRKTKKSGKTPLKD